jgi:hypothetical protein
LYEEIALSPALIAYLVFELCPCSYSVLPVVSLVVVSLPLVGASPAAAAALFRRLRNEWMQASIRIMNEAGTVIVSRVSFSMISLHLMTWN